MEWNLGEQNFVKRFHIRSYSDPYFPAFELNTDLSLYSVQMREHTNHKNSEYGHFSRIKKLSHLISV